MIRLIFNFKADPALSNARFYLVPKYIREPKFWRNYFFRVYLIKEAYGLNHPNTNQTITKITSSESETQPTPEITPTQSSERIPAQRSVTEDFVSDDFVHIDKINLDKELGQLGVSPGTGSWEAALEQELKGTVPRHSEDELTLDDAWEEQMKQELEQELK